MHVSGDHRVLAIADSDVLGMVFEEGELFMEVGKNFYGGEECSEDQARELAAEATIINAVGKKIVKLLSDDGMVDKSMILEIGGVHHAQVIRI